MNRSIKSLIVCLVSACLASAAFGATTRGGLEITSMLESTGDVATFRVEADATPQSAADVEATLMDAATFSLFVDTMSDILLFDASLEVLDGTFYNAGAANLGSDTKGASAALLGAFPVLAADSYITTPAEGTAAAGTTVLDSMGTMITHFDSVDSGAQQNFKFGQFTLIPNADGRASAILRGELQTAANPTPIKTPFSVNLTVGVPEPGALPLLATALLGLVAIRRRR